MKMMEIVAAELIQEHLGIKKNKRELSFPELVNEFLKQNTHWSISTRRLYTYILSSYLEGKNFQIIPQVMLFTYVILTVAGIGDSKTD